MIIQENISLLPYNTFHIDASARYFTVIKTVDDAKAVFASELFRSGKHLLLGGGSNMLLTGNYDGLVVKNELKGIKVVEENADQIVVKASSGENWHEFVSFCVSRDFGGIENLSLIPGTCGAAPMQNIGAYGVELRDVLREVEAINIKTGEVKTFSKEDCQFGYRESVFKHELKNLYFISSITLSLTKTNHRFNTSYGAITDVLRDQHANVVTVRTISEAVIFIRKSKLPDPAVIGNAGSFFKNPTIKPEHFGKLKADFPMIPSYPTEEGLIKIPAGWLIEQSGWKGKTFENIGVHKHQALVLVNYGGGDGNKIWNLAMQIQSSVREKFNIDLHPEVNVI